MKALHIEASPDQIAPFVMLPGDPLRAKHIAETFFENPNCYNQIRNMFGFTGNWQGQRVSVQGTGMGIPSMSIYVNELIRFYNAKTLIRVGTCGSIHPDLKCGDIILAQGGCSDGNINNHTFSGMNFAPIADFDLLRKAARKAEELNLHFKTGNVLSSDVFYNDNKDFYRIWADHNVLGIEMETAGLYTIAAKHKVRALSILTVSDNILTGELSTPTERQTSFTTMVHLALSCTKV
ncbi:purine-nucleoside phosphorylase [Myxococcota bacterium]|nr:purine-nucleoside phosphorylase [Myxococcota bacterium]MBU1382956.1 purine-nucleoside phosphorylase [Myxococcota bacterium]MBU1495482.1 purine-nucleoside phosphorylase [Myxococcota bacterium]